MVVAAASGVLLAAEAAVITLWGSAALLIVEWDDITASAPAWFRWGWVELVALGLVIIGGTVGVIVGGTYAYDARSVSALTVTGTVVDSGSTDRFVNSTSVRYELRETEHEAQVSTLSSYDRGDRVEVLVDSASGGDAMIADDPASALSPVGVLLLEVGIVGSVLAGLVVFGFGLAWMVGLGRWCTRAVLGQVRSIRPNRDRDSW
jgi:hypothetical protein